MENYSIKYVVLGLKNTDGVVKVSNEEVDAYIASKCYIAGEKNMILPYTLIGKSLVFSCTPYDKTIKLYNSFEKAKVQAEIRNEEIEKNLFFKIIPGDKAWKKKLQQETKKHIENIKVSYEFENLVEEIDALDIEEPKQLKKY